MPDDDDDELELVDRFDDMVRRLLDEVVGDLAEHASAAHGAIDRWFDSLDRQQLAEARRAAAQIDREDGPIDLDRTIKTMLAPLSESSIRWRHHCHEKLTGLVDVAIATSEMAVFADSVVRH